MGDNNSKYTSDLQSRLLKFSIDVVKFLFLLPMIKEMEVFRFQLSKSATSVGANYEESQAGTYNEFRNRIQICLREARETHYFLKVLSGLKLENSKYGIKDKAKYSSELLRLINEADEIKRIFGSISKKTQKEKSK